MVECCLITMKQGRELHVRVEGEPRNRVEDHAQTHTSRVGEGPVWKGKEAREG